MDSGTRIAILGGGLAGLTAAGFLQRAGFAVCIYEQSTSFARIGAGIILGANVSKVLRGLNLEQRLVETGIRPDAFVSRAWDTGETLYELKFDADCEKRFDGAFVNIHRADLHALLLGAVAANSIRFDHKLVGLEHAENALVLRFGNGLVAETDIIIGADGIRSKVRETIMDTEEPHFIGRVAPRAVFSPDRIRDLNIRDCTKWWGTDRHLLTYFTTPRRDEIYVMGAVPSDRWEGDLSPVRGNVDEFIAAFRDFHPEVRRVVEAATDVTVWPICDRPRNDRWYEGPIVLTGDACHAVRPFMAAGGSMAIEDAAILSRCIVEFDDPATAFARYASLRIPRVAEVQRISAENSWMRGPTKTDWFFGYDPCGVPLDSTPYLDEEDVNHALA